jgi:transposase
MRAYSEDLRKKTVSAIERGMPKAQAARPFDVGLSSVKRYSRTAREGRPLKPRKSPGRPNKIGEEGRLLLDRDLEERPAERPAATIAQRRRFLEHITATTLSDSTVRRPMKRLGYSQKTDCGALERDEFFRATWKVMVAEQVEPERLVFIEEMGTNIALSPSCLPSTPGRRKAGGPLVRASQPGSQHHLAI